MSSIRYIFGCKHENRIFFSHTFFERGLKIPLALCEDCVDKTNYAKVNEIKN